MSSAQTKAVSASRQVGAAPDRIFEMIADPSRQPEWDGNNLAGGAPGQRVRTDLEDESRFPRARATTSERLAASVGRLAALVESERDVTDRSLRKSGRQASTMLANRGRRFGGRDG